MSLTDFSEQSRVNPLDVVERVATTNRWSFERAAGGWEPRRAGGGRETWVRAGVARGGVRAGGAGVGGGPGPAGVTRRWRAGTMGERVGRRRRGRAHGAFRH